MVVKLDAIFYILRLIWQHLSLSLSGACRRCSAGHPSWFGSACCCRCTNRPARAARCGHLTGASLCLLYCNQRVECSGRVPVANLYGEEQL